MFPDIDYSGWTQVVLAILTLAVSSAASKLLVYKFYGFKAICTPIKPNLSGLSRAWDISIKNKSRLFGQFTILVYPSRPGNFVKSFHLLSPNDGGLVSRSEISEGGLEILLKRFTKSRMLKVRILFSYPDSPDLESSTQFTINRIIKSAPIIDEIFELNVTYHRMMLIMFLFIGMTFFIVARLALMSRFTSLTSGSGI